MNQERFATVESYNAAYPSAQLPTDPVTRHGLRGYQAAMSGIADDVTGDDGTFTVDFLPGGAPARNLPDRIGNVVATRWGDGPVLVLAERVSLRTAWRAITDAWPTRLSETSQALSRATDEPVTPWAHAD